MKPMFSIAGRAAVLSALAMLSACASGQRESASPERETMQGMSSGGSMATIDMAAMCDMYERMAHAKTPEEQQASMGDWMKNMSPEMRRRHMEALQAECEGAPADRGPNQRK